MPLTNRQIHDALLYEPGHEAISEIESQLRERLAGMHDGMTKADLMSLLVIAVLKKNFIETDEIRALVDDYLQLVRETEVSLRRPTEGIMPASGLSYRIFAALTIRRCAYMETLLLRLGADRSADRVRIVRHSLRLAMAWQERRYGRYLAYLLYKYSTLFGTSFVALFACILFNTFVFAGIMYAHDIVVSDHLISETGALASFDYYSYISLATLSNLGADTSFASDLFLRVLFGIEQVAGLVLFGLAIILLGRRFR